MPFYYSFSIAFPIPSHPISIEKKLDNDDPEHIEWLYQQASNRAAEFDIEGVTWSLTQGVVKNIIPAIASTNAIIAGKLDIGKCPKAAESLDISAVFSLAACCNEAFKIATTCAPYLNNYMMACTIDGLLIPRISLIHFHPQYVGNDSLYTFTFEHEKRPECPVCGGQVIEIEVKKDWKLSKLIDWLTERQDM